MLYLHEKVYFSKFRVKENGAICTIIKAGSYVYALNHLSICLPCCEDQQAFVSVAVCAG